MVKKSNGKWQMCVDYSNLNKSYPKDLYPLLSINGLVDTVFGYQGSFLYRCLHRYNQIPMHPRNEKRIAFITPMANYCYKVMPFDLKNTGTMYQRLMNKVFSEHIGYLIEIYIDDMLVKTKKEDNLLSNLEVVYSCLQ